MRLAILSHLPLTKLQTQVVSELEAAGGELCYEDLALRLWPKKERPAAWRRPPSGGPCPWAMPLGRALSALRRKNLVVDAVSEQGRPVRLLAKKAGVQCL